MSAHTVILQYHSYKNTRYYRLGQVCCTQLRFLIASITDLLFQPTIMSAAFFTLVEVFCAPQGSMATIFLGLIFFY